MLTTQLTKAQDRPSSAASITGPIDIGAFGAKCDGSTDDFAAITAALARVAQVPGAVVFFPPAATPCMVSRALKLPDNVTLRSTPATVTLKPTASNMSNPMLLSAGNNVRVEGLSFDGGGKDHPNTANVILGFKVSNVIFDHIALRHTRGIGLVMSSNIVNSAVLDSTFEDLGNHWKTSHDPKDRIQGVVFCCGTGNRGNIARNNRFADIGLDALQFSDQSDITVAGNRFDLANNQHSVIAAPDFPSAIFPFRVNGANITGNVIAGAQGACIDAPGLINAVISHNTITGCAGPGIGLFDSHTYRGSFAPTDHVTVSDNIITNTGNWTKNPFPGGIALFGQATNVSLSRNKISDTQQRKTQLYAIYGKEGATLSGLKIDQSNDLQGNAKSAIGGTARVP